MTDDNSVLDPLEQWSPTLFLVSGVVLVGFAASLAAIGLMDISLPRNVFAGAGFTLAFLGLLGLYPGLADWSPRLARAGAVFAVLGALGFAVTFVLGVAEVRGITPPAWVEPIQLLNIIGLVLGFFVFGVGTLRTDMYARLLGILLLVPAVVFAVNLVRVGVLGAWTPSWAPFLLGSLQALAMLSIGYSLRAESAATERPEGPTDMTA
jgi:hypothetical protein